MRHDITKTCSEQVMLRELETACNSLSHFMKLTCAKWESSLIERRENLRGILKAAKRLRAWNFLKFFFFTKYLFNNSNEDGEKEGNKEWKWKRSRLSRGRRWWWWKLKWRNSLKSHYVATFSTFRSSFFFLFSFIYFLISKEVIYWSVWVVIWWEARHGEFPRKTKRNKCRLIYTHISMEKDQRSHENRNFGNSFCFPLFANFFFTTLWSPLEINFLDFRACLSLRLIHTWLHVTSTIERVEWKSDQDDATKHYIYWRLKISRERRCRGLSRDWMSESYDSRYQQKNSWAVFFPFSSWLSIRDSIHMLLGRKATTRYECLLGWAVKRKNFSILFHVGGWMVAMEFSEFPSCLVNLYASSASTIQERDSPRSFHVNSTSSPHTLPSLSLHTICNYN